MTFLEIKKTGDREWIVENKKSGDFLGYIEYFSRWRRMVFAPANDTVFTQDCLLDLHDFMEENC